MTNFKGNDWHEEPNKDMEEKLQEQEKAVRDSMDDVRRDSMQSSLSSQREANQYQRTNLNLEGNKWA